MSNPFVEKAAGSVYICAPLRGPDIEANIERARMGAEKLFQDGFFPVCPHI